MLCPLTGIRAKSRSSRFRFSSCRCGASTVALGAMARKECDLVCKGRPRFTGVGGGEAASWKRCGVEDREVGPARNFGWSVHIYPPAILARQLRCISTETPPNFLPTTSPPSSTHPSGVAPISASASRTSTTSNLEQPKPLSTTQSRDMSAWVWILGAGATAFFVWLPHLCIGSYGRLGYGAAGTARNVKENMY